MENKKLFYFALILLMASLVILLVNINKVVNLTGKVTGTTNLTIVERVEINFTTNIVNWSNGSVTSGQARATLVSNGTVTNGNWTTVSSGLILENIGNQNVSLTFVTTQTGAAAFIGGTSPEYMWNFTSSEATSCTFNATTTAATFYDANSSLTRKVCDTFNFADARDQLRVDIRLVIPSDATQTGVPIGDTIVATATDL